MKKTKKYKVPNLKFKEATAEIADEIEVEPTAEIADEIATEVEEEDFAVRKKIEWEASAEGVEKLATLAEINIQIHYGSVAP